MSSRISRLRTIAPLALVLALVVALLSATPAQAATGSISGTAKKSNGSGASSGEVYALEWDSGSEEWVEAGWSEVASNGSYKIEDLPDGQYAVCFAAWELAFQCWNNKLVPDAANPVTISGGNAVTGINFKVIPGGSISGNVKGNSGKALRDAEVLALLKVGSDWYFYDFAYTDSKGNYKISVLPAGTYRLCFWADGLVEECWNDKLDFDKATNITVGTNKKVTGKNAQLTTTGPAPAVPSGLRATQTELESLALEWTESWGAEKYRIRYGAASNGKGAKTVEIVGDNAAVLDLLKANTTYYVDIASVSETGKVSAYSKRSKFKTKALPAPQNLMATQTTVDSLTVAWTKSVGATKYRVRYGTASNGKGAKTVNIGDEGELAIPGLKANTTYYVDVASLTDAGSLSSYTKRIKVKTPPVPVPTAVALTATPSTATVTWVKSTGAVKYRVRYGTAKNGKGAKTLYVDDVDTLTIEKLKANTTYWIDVAAVTGPGSVSAYTKRTSIKTAPIVKPDAPSLDDATQSSVLLTWTKSDAATKYRVRYGTASSGKGAKTVEVGDVAELRLEKLKAKTVYYVDVAAVTAGGSVSPYTTRLSLETLPILAPTGLDATPTSTSLALTWDASEGATKYRIRYGTASNGKGAKTVETANLFTTLSGLKANTPYFIDVAAVTAGGSVSSYTSLVPFSTTP